MVKQTAIKINRTPVIPRTSIISRIAQGSENFEYDSCRLCNNFEDCSGYSYATPEQSLELKASKSKHRKIYIPKGYEAWDELLMTIRALQLLHVNVRLVTEVKLPDDIVWGLSYSPLNILQVNVDIVKSREDMGWVGNTFSMTDKCGVYSILFLYPLVPTVTKTYHIIEIIDNYKNICNHVSLKFIDFPKLKETKGYINFNGTAVPVKYLKPIQNGYCCSDSYIKEFTEIVQSYTTPRKISISICNSGEDCTGLGMEE